MQPADVVRAIGEVPSRPLSIWTLPSEYNLPVSRMRENERRSSKLTAQKLRGTTGAESDAAAVSWKDGEFPDGLNSHVDADR